MNIAIIRILLLTTTCAWLGSAARWGPGPGYPLRCLAASCSPPHPDPACCSAAAAATGRSLQPMANWRFGSIFRNSIPPVRPYKAPTFEDIFETDHSSKAEAEQQAASVLQLGPPAAGGRTSDPLQQFSNILSEYSRTSLPQQQGPSLAQKAEDYLQGALFSPATTPAPAPAPEEARKLRLLELAREELRRKQQRKAQYIKAQQRHDQYVQLLQNQDTQLVKEPRSQDLDNFFAKVKDFNNNKGSQKKLKHELIKRYHEKLMKKSGSHEKSEKEAALSQIHGRPYVDMSSGTRILDGEMSRVASQLGHAALHVTQTTEATTTSTTTTTTTTTTPPPPPTTPRLEAEDEAANEVGVAGGRGKSVVFTRALCDKLRVPCRFVTEHPCCALPQGINMVGRPRAMDGSADLKWRLYQSRRGTQAAASPLGRGRNKADGRMLPGFSSGAAASLRYNSNIPYSSWTQPTDIRVPRYFYDGGPDLTSTILKQCWRLTYLNCLRDREHPCCGLTSKRDSLANNPIDRWLTRY